MRTRLPNPSAAEFPASTRDESAAAGRERFDLIAPYERDPGRWSEVEWVDAECGDRHAVTTSELGGRDAIRVKSIRDVVALYR